MSIEHCDLGLAYMTNINILLLRLCFVGSYMSRMLKLWHNWWIVGLANGEIDALGVVAWTDVTMATAITSALYCHCHSHWFRLGSVDPVQLLESLNTDTSRPVSEQLQCVTVF